MKTLTLFLRRTLWVAAFSFLVPVGSAHAAADLGEAAGSVSVPAGTSMEAVQDAIVKALLGRKWDVQSKDSNKVVGYLKHRSNEATVTLVYSETKVDLFCVGYQIDKKTGAREKPEQPKGWLNNIRSDLGKILNRPAGGK